MAVYLAAVLTLAFLAFSPWTDSFGAYTALWVVCLPTSALLGPYSFIAAGLADVVLDDLLWVFSVAWWGLVAGVQISVFWVGRGCCSVWTSLRSRCGKRSTPTICRV